MSHKVIIVSPDANLASTLRDELARTKLAPDTIILPGYETPQKLCSLLDLASPLKAAIIIDFAEPAAALDLIRHLRDKRPELWVAAMGHSTSSESVLATMRAGASDYLVPPFNLQHFEQSLMSKNQAKVTGFRGDSGHNAVSKISGRAVLVTGAGGAIGSELCRQLANCRPKVVVGLDRSEQQLSQIDREMRRLHPDVPFVVQIGDTADAARVRELLRRYEVSLLYHAASYKHVGMMEVNACEAVHNNVLGARHLADLAAECGVEDFVLISSHKALRPTSVLGAASRVAELLILAGDEDGLNSKGCRRMAVRFGNVLGSSDSVVPLFEQQIASGGPVTVTHPEMTRSFIGVSEAAQLVLEASAMGQGGEVFAVRMGEPLRILDVAHNLIQLADREPARNIEVIFTGPRPWEKLQEERSDDPAVSQSTLHEEIRLVTSASLSAEQAQLYTKQFEQLCAQRSVAGIVFKLKEIVADYVPSATLIEEASRECGTDKQRAGSLAKLAAAVEVEKAGNTPVRDITPTARVTQ